MQQEMMEGDDDLDWLEKQYSSFFADDLTPTRHFSNPVRRNVETPQNMRKNPPTKSENAEAEENGEENKEMSRGSLENIYNKIRELKGEFQTVEEKLRSACEALPKEKRKKNITLGDWDPLSTRSSNLRERYSDGESFLSSNDDATNTPSNRSDVSSPIYPFPPSASSTVSELGGSLSDHSTSSYQPSYSSYQPSSSSYQPSARLKLPSYDRTLSRHSRPLSPVSVRTVSPEQSHYSDTTTLTSPTSLSPGFSSPLSPMSPSVSSVSPDLKSKVSKYDFLSPISASRLSSLSSISPESSCQISYDDTLSPLSHSRISSVNSLSPRSNSRISASSISSRVPQRSYKSSEISTPDPLSPFSPSHISKSPEFRTSYTRPKSPISSQNGSYRRPRSPISPENFSSFSTRSPVLPQKTSYVRPKSPVLPDSISFVRSTSPLSHFHASRSHSPFSLLSSIYDDIFLYNRETPRSRKTRYDPDPDPELSFLQCTNKPRRGALSQMNMCSNKRWVVLGSVVFKLELENWVFKRVIQGSRRKRNDPELSVEDKEEIVFCSTITEYLSKES